MKEIPYTVPTFSLTYVSVIFRSAICSLSLLLTVLLCGCSGQKSNDAANDTLSSVVNERQVIDHNDTASHHKDALVGRYIRNIVKQAIHSDSSSTSQAFDRLLEGLKGDTMSLRTAFKYADLYLHNPQSRTKNDRLFILFIESLLRRPGLPGDVAERAIDKLRIANLNREGTIANDFSYIDRNGKEGTLHSIAAAQTMLIFYDPECPHCPAILKRIANSRNVNKKIDAGTLQVLAVYAEGKREVWEESKGDLPELWTVAYDQTGILDRELYDLPAMPIVYLLDADKRILIKDMPW